MALHKWVYGILVLVIAPLIAGDGAHLGVLLVLFGLLDCWTEFGMMIQLLFFTRAVVFFL